MNLWILSRSRFHVVDSFKNVHILENDAHRKKFDRKELILYVEKCVSHLLLEKFISRLERRNFFYTHRQMNLLCTWKK